MFTPLLRRLFVAFSIILVLCAGFLLWVMGGNTVTQELIEPQDGHVLTEWEVNSRAIWYIPWVAPDNVDFEVTSYIRLNSDDPRGYSDYKSWEVTVPGIGASFTIQHYKDKNAATLISWDPAGPSLVEEALIPYGNVLRVNDTYFTVDEASGNIRFVRPLGRPVFSFWLSAYENFVHYNALDSQEPIQFYSLFQNGAFTKESMKPLDKEQWYH